MNESEMEYRVSKSEINTEKEQRVDGHKCLKLRHLKYTIMGFERSYQIRIPSNHLITYIRSYTSLRRIEGSHHLVILSLLSK